CHLFLFYLVSKLASSYNFTSKFKNFSWFSFYVPDRSITNNGIESDNALVKEYFTFHSELKLNQEFLKKSPRLASEKK
ncbi:hypothetical protein BpHYR1_005309, partial [Brachionus plicatilis]